MTYVGNPSPRFVEQVLDEAREGDNRPPEDADPLRERLERDYEDIALRARDLIGAEERLPASLTDETVGKVSDYARQIKACIKWVDDSRKAEKQPYLDAGRTIDGWFGHLIEQLKALTTRVEGRVTAYMRAKEAEERRRREEEARRLQAEAKALAEAGDKAQAKEVRAEAKELREEAKTAKAADLVRTHTGMGGVATLRTSIDFEVKDKAAAVSFLWHDIDDEALAKAIRKNIRADTKERITKNPKDQPIPGVRLFLSGKASIR